MTSLWWTSPPTTAEPVAISEPTPHQRHYAEFYGLTEPAAGYGVVVGNCQAESLRIVLDAADRPTVRVPAVHELTSDEAPRLHALLAGARWLVAQPVRDDYHGLPLGTRQLRASLRAGARVATFTPVRYTALYPFQSPIHVDGVDDVPPLVAYHDVRILAEAAGLPVASRLAFETVRALADDSLAELRRREEQTDVVYSDLLRPEAAYMRTVNHPGNALWLPLAERVLATLGLAGRPTDPGRPLLNAVHTPLEPWVVDAWGGIDEPRDQWIVNGERVDPADVREAHLEWYARHPQFVAGAVESLRPLLTRWR